MNEGREEPKVFWDFKNERNAKQFAKDVENSGVGLANSGVERYKGKYRVVITGMTTDMHKKAIGKYAHKNKGEFSHSTSEVTPKGYGPYDESVELDEKRLPHAHEPEARIKAGIESGKFPMVNSKLSVLGGNSVFGVFQFTGKAAGGGPEPGSPGVDGYVMAITSDPKRGKVKIFAYYGSHPHKDWAISKYTQSHGLLGESVELDEESHWVLSFEFNKPEYTSTLGRQIQKDLDKKFKSYSGSGSGGAGWDISFNGSKKELEKVKKYVEKEYKNFIDSKQTQFVMDESVELDEGKMKEFFMDIHDELKKAMDKKWYREMQSSNGAQGLDNIISNTHKQLYNSGDPDPKDIADAIIAKYGRNHKEYMKLSLDMMRRNESVMDLYVKHLSKDTTPQLNKSARLSFDARTLDARTKDV